MYRLTYNKNILGKSSEYEDIRQENTDNGALFSIVFDKGFSLFVEATVLNLLYRYKHEFAINF